jgi:hypothetical protein
MISTFILRRLSAIKVTNITQTGTRIEAVKACQWVGSLFSPASHQAPMLHAQIPSG